jgi:hypothetical protein
MNPSEHTGPDSVDDALGGVHERLDRRVEQLEASVLAGSVESANALSSLTRDLLHHMAWEDQFLFPAVKGVATAKERRSIESLEIDHDRLRDTLGSLESTLAAGDFGTAGTLVRWLRTLLAGHNYDEDHGVYVEADRLLSRADRRRLIAQASADAGPSAGSETLPPGSPEQEHP